VKEIPFAYSASLWYPEPLAAAKSTLPHKAVLECLKLRRSIIQDYFHHLILYMNIRHLALIIWHIKEYVL
jgi:hypothetical protein